MAALTYMQRRKGSGIYEFRRRLPQSLAGKPAPEHCRDALAEIVNSATGCFKRELTISLGTSDPGKAKRLDMRQAIRVADLFEMATAMVHRGPGSSTTGGAFPSPAEIEADTFAGILKADEEEREEGDGRRHLQSREERLQWLDLSNAEFGAKGMAEGHLEALGLMVDMLGQDYRRALAERRPEIVRAELHGYLKGRGVPIDPNSDFYRAAGLAVLRGHVAGYEAIAARQAGNDIPTPVAGEGKGPKLSEAFTEWQAQSPARGGRSVAPKTVREGERAVRRFQDWHGDLRLGDITKEKARDFRDAISRLPRDLTEKERGLSLRALLKDGLPGRLPPTAETVNKQINLLSAIVGFAEKEGRQDKVAGFANPFRNLSLTLDKRQAEGRDVFSGADLRAFFASPVFAHGARPAGGGGEAAFWLPVVALMSGARQAEIAQLRITDLHEDADSKVWLFDIGTSGSRSVKTAGSKRQVPVHPELVRLGLLSYREHMLDAATKAGMAAPEMALLWPEVRSNDKLNASAAYSKWFNRYLRVTAGITGPGLVFHSFRHTFKRSARDAGIAEEVHDVLTGHSGGGVGRTYGKGVGLKALDAAMRSIAVPASLAAVPAWSPSARRSVRGSTKRQYWRDAS